MNASVGSNEWLELARNILATCGKKVPLEEALVGAKVWIGASRSNAELAEHRRKLCVAYRSIGATILGDHEHPVPFESELCLAELEAADLILMLAASPGVSVRALEICHRRKSSSDTMRDRMTVYLPNEFQNGYIHRLLANYGAKVRHVSHKEFLAPGGELFRTSLFNLIDERTYQANQIMKKKSEFKPKIGIVTALPVEFTAVKQILSEIRRDFSQQGTYNEFWHGTIKSDYGDKDHHVVLVNGGKGTNNAALAAQSLIGNYPTVHDVFMVGIAGGVPDLKNASAHVRLGDIVVCSNEGVVATDHVKYRHTGVEHEPTPRAPSADWTKRLNGYLSEHGARRYWAYLDKMLLEHKFKRPAFGPLKDTPWIKNSMAARHPKDATRVLDRPKIHVANIGTANALIRNAEVRDRLKKKFNVRAVEMEAAGIAAATWQNNIGYLVVRGICDYANDDKNKIWQPYAATAAAAFTRDLIESMPVRSETR